jgi:biopolymer transport protein TolR
MQFSRKPRTPKSFLDITPIVDTVFNLLIFFAVSLSFIASSAIHVDLPKAEVPASEFAQKDLRLTITHANRVFLNDKEMRNPAELAQSLREVAAVQTATNVFIEADEQVPHGKVVALMDLANGVGLQKVAIVTQLKTTKEPATSF